MQKSEAFIYLFFAALMLLTGCFSKDITRDQLASGIVNSCFELTEPGLLIQARGEDKARHFLTFHFLALSVEGQNHRWQRDGLILRRLPIGTRLIIDQVVDYPYGFSGNCWIVKVKLLETEVKDSVEIPSCFLYDQPIWVTPRSPHDIKHGEQLRIETEALTPSACRVDP